ncbi:hypothetical protein [Hydrocarboniphaga effusa]|uniref:hypothetical protein n=1 Tax=Hydrocarboniphaga effusa TaxID=243629 RepID=UPI00398C0C43
MGRSLKTEALIAYEAGRHWVGRDTAMKCYRVYRQDATHSVLRGTYGDGCEGGSLQRAIADCDRREAEMQKA